jgi:o-succinylbenzoate synthase
MSFQFQHHTLFFRKPAVTSRDKLTTRDVYFVRALSENHEVAGIGECAPIWGLSPESKAHVERTIADWPRIMDSPAALKEVIDQMSSMRFALEMAMLDLAGGGNMLLFPVDLNRSIPINGLVWMSDIRTMIAECREKIAAGYSTIKFKVGALGFEDELGLLRKMRAEYAHADLEIRLDANGAFLPDVAIEKLDALSDFRIHSIEQPMRAGNWEQMAELVEKTPIPIALDEELIGIHDTTQKAKLLDTIKPHYLVLKPTLHGAFSGCDEWIAMAEERVIRWWATSALESNVGLNAIAQWLLTKNTSMPQGLGTGMLFTNNIPSPWEVSEGFLKYNADLNWNLKPLFR